MCVVRLLSLSIAATFVAAANYDFFNVSSSKDVRCHRPSLYECNSSLYPILDYKLSAWYFQPAFKSCLPLYSSGGLHNCTSNKDLPSTKEECENLCAEACKMSDGSDGICMMEEYCKGLNEKSSAHPRPCTAYNVKCCPRGYKPPTKKTATNAINTPDNWANGGAAKSQSVPHRGLATRLIYD